MTEQPFVSYARNGEDVVLWRAMGDVHAGRFLEFGPAGTPESSALAALTERGWSGAVAAIAELSDRTAVPRHATDRGSGSDLHALVVSSDLAFPDDLESIARMDLSDVRPWVLVLGLLPSSDLERLTEVATALGYTFCHYDGVSAFYVAAERRDEYGPALGYPACVRDNWMPAPVARALARADGARLSEARAVESALRWRDRAVSGWADASVGRRADSGDITELRRLASGLDYELAQIRRTVSWRMTAPLRTVRRITMRQPQR